MRRMVKAHAKTDKPPLKPLPCTPEHQAMRQKSRAASAFRQLQRRTTEAEVAERLDAIRALLKEHGPMQISDIMERLGTTKHKARYALRELANAAEIVCIDRYRWQMMNTTRGAK